MKKSSAIVTVTASTPTPPTDAVNSVTVNPASATVEQGETRQFTAEVAVTGNASQAVNWSVSGHQSAGTSISQDGLLTVGVDETATTLMVTAVSQVDSLKKSSAIVTVTASTPTPPTDAVNSVTVNPASATVEQGETRQFTAEVAVTGNASQAVNWSVSGHQSAGTTISQGGLLTVGADETAATLTVTAVSQVDSSKKSSAIVTVVAPGTPIQPAAYTVTVENDGNGTAQASVTSAKEGEEVTLTAEPKEGYRFKEWQVVPEDIVIEGNTFTMPENL